MAKVKYYAKENSTIGTHSFYAVPIPNGTLTFGDLEVMDVKESVIKDGDDLKAVYEGKDGRVKIAVTNVHRPDDIPAWSLTALLNLCPYGGLEHVSDKWFFSVKDYKGEMFETPIEAAVDAVCWFKEKGII